MLLSKGFEIEIYTGTPQGEIVGLSDRIVKNLAGFVREPDKRNVEYTTAPLYSYDRLLCALVRPRQILRAYLAQLGNYTLIPGSTLSLGGRDRFYRSDPQNPYHDYIENTYHTDVVTASVHINIGISDPEKLMQAIRLIRVEAPLYLALSASSPFLDSKPTGYHSTRWQMFPKNPVHVPLFESHSHHIRWTEEQLELGHLRNVRHLWSSVRPNGDRRPYNLNRLELRICDLVVDPIALLAVTALLEARILQVLADSSLDPLQLSPFDNEELVQLTEANEKAVAQDSLDAKLHHWLDGHSLLARDWVESLYEDVWQTAKDNGFSCFLLPLQPLLREGNTSQQWLSRYEQGQSAQQILSQAIQNVLHQEQDLEEKLCQPLVA